MIQRTSKVGGIRLICSAHEYSTPYSLVFKLKSRCLAFIAQWDAVELKKKNCVYIGMLNNEYFLCRRRPDKCEIIIKTVFHNEAIQTESVNIIVCQGNLVFRLIYTRYWNEKRKFPSWIWNQKKLISDYSITYRCNYYKRKW